MDVNLKRSDTKLLPWTNGYEKTLKENLGLTFRVALALRLGQIDVF